MRLTNKIRNAILEKIEKEKWLPKVRALRDRLDRIAIKAMERKYDKKTREWMAQCPTSGAFVEVSSIPVRLKDAQFDWKHDALCPWVEHQGYRNKRRRYRERYTPRLGRNYPLLARDMNDRCLVINKSEIIELEMAADKALQAWERFEEFSRQALWACSTMKQLNERYPSLAAHAPEREQGVANMIAVTDDKIAEAFKAL